MINLQDALAPWIGKTIMKLTIDDEALCFVFSEEYGNVYLRQGQSCCETRYMTTDDHPGDYVGATLLGAEVEDGPDMDGYGEHQTQFLRIRTSKGVFVAVTHNEHNGYYGGFDIEVVR